MTRSIFLSLVFHTAMIVLTAISLPLMMRTPIDLPPIISVELIQISDTTSIPFAPKARETFEKIKNIESDVVKPIEINELLKHTPQSDFSLPRDVLKFEKHPV